VACHGVDKKMKERIVSVKKTGKLTDAMRLVAAAKVRKAQEGVEKARPFSMELQSMIKGLVKKLKGSGLESELPMLRVPEKTTEVGMLVIGSNKGLCGAYNGLVAKYALARTLELNKEGITPKIVIVGKKMRIQINSKFERGKAQYNYTEIYFDMPDTVTAKESTAIAEAVRNLFLSGEVDKVEAVYGKFINLVTNEPSIRTILPLSPTGIENAEDETFKMSSEDGKLKTEKIKQGKVQAKEIESDVIFDQPPATILSSMLPLYLNSQVLAMMFDGQASELSARMTAMKAATDNAKELAETLTVKFNKKRQAAITQELCEICSAGLALEDSSKGEGPPMGAIETPENVLADLVLELDTGSIPESPTIETADGEYR